MPDGLLARAKVNLYLHVTGRRSDGYHELDSLFVRTDLADRLTLAPAAADRLTLSGPFAHALADAPIQGNLVMRALAAVRARCDSDQPLSVILEKNIPVAAGLGGGSADAAAALAGVAALLDADLDEVALARLAASLGADVPACLHETPLAVSGIGERLTPLESLPSFALLLVNPGVPLATAAVFAARRGGFSTADPMTVAKDLDGLVEALSARRNDLEQAAIALAPQVGTVLELLAGLPQVRLARMSGSGATCFALCDDLAVARTLAAQVRRAQPSWWVAPTAVAGTR